MGHLAKASAAGLVVLAFTFLIIMIYGLQQLPILSTEEEYNLLPLNGISGISHWFGCVAFGFGVVPLTYNYYDSMARPQEMVQATSIALFLVALGYIMIGSGLLILYPSIDTDLLEALPKSGPVPATVRLSMVVVIIASSPLLVLPCGELIEGKLHKWFHLEPSRVARIITRMSICLVCTIISVVVPGFVYVLSFVGCFSVATVSFIFPPLLHLCLASRTQNFANSCIDAGFTFWGVIATVISTTCTFKQLLK